MNGIQLILLTGLVFIGLYFVIRLKKRVLDVVLLGFMFICAGIFILWPDITNTIAGMLGVGRGADLIFYISIMIFWFVLLKLFARIRRLEQTITEMIRQDAINKAEHITDKSSNR